MEPNEEQGTTSLRDEIEAQVEAVEALETPVVEAPPGETSEQKAGRLAGRARDELGRVLPGKAVKPEPIEPAPVVAPIERPARPSSWKKDYWDHWDKLDPSLATYLHQREQEYAKGVSTYKTEADYAKPLMEAMAPFLPQLQKHGIQPQQWITNLGNAHQTLALGTPQEKLMMFQRLAQDYQVPLQALFQQQQGQPDPLQYVNPLYQQIQQLSGKLEQLQSSREQEQQQTIQQEIQKFASTHPHYESVRETMAGLLQSNVAPDLETAYDKAIRLHDDIFDQVQADKAKAQAEEKLKQTKETASRARANAVSPRSATTSAATTSKGDKGLRDTISDAVDEVESGRV